MASLATRALPQDRALNVRLGLLLLVLGLVLVFVSFSGDQAYDMAFFFLAILGTVLCLYGTVLLANSRVVSEKRRRLHQQAKTGVREWIRLQCPTCQNSFEAEGVRPFTAVCPSCATSGEIP